MVAHSNQKTKNMAEKDIVLRVSAITNKEVMEEFGEVLNTVLGSYEDNVQLLAQYNQSINDTSQKIKALNKEQKTWGKLTDAQTRQYAELIEQERKEKQARSELQIVMKNQEKLMQAEKGSMREASLILAQLRTAYRQMTDEQKTAHAGMLSAIYSLDKYLKQADASIGNFQRNVGNYPGLMNQMTSAAASMASSINPTLGKVAQKFIEVSTSQEAVAAGSALTTGAIATLAGGIGGALVVFKGFQQAMELTQSVGDAVTISVAGWESAFDKFIRTVASGDFSNFIQGLRDARQAGEELARTLDEMTERNNALKIARAEASVEQQKNLKIMRDQTRAMSERIAAGNAYIASVREQANIEREIAEQEFNARLRDYAKQSGMSEEDAQFYIKNYNKYRNALNSYNEELAAINDAIAKKEQEITDANLATANALITGIEVNTRQADDLDKQRTKELAQLKAQRTELVNGYNSEQQRFISLQKKYNNVNDELTSQLVGAWERVYTAISQAEKKTNEAAATVSGLTKREQKEQEKKATQTYKGAATKGVLGGKSLWNTIGDPLRMYESDLTEMDVEYSPFAQQLGLTPEEIEDLKSKAISAAQSIYNSIQQVSKENIKRRLDNELEQITAESKKEENILKAKLDKNIITQKQYEQKLALLNEATEERKEEARKEAFQKEKAWNITNALMNMALAITNIWATNRGGAVARAIETGIATAAGIAQVATIAAQKYARGGELHGASHAQGGIKGNVQGHNIELEGDEVVINKRSARKYRRALSWINSDNGWGVDFAGVRGMGGYSPQLKFARGGVLGSYDFSPSATPRTSSMQQAMVQQASRVEELVGAINKRIDRLQVYVAISDIESASNTKRVHTSRAKL